jgi:hypothetical protein
MIGTQTEGYRRYKISPPEFHYNQVAFNLLYTRKVQRPIFFALKSIGCKNKCTPLRQLDNA